MNRLGATTLGGLVGVIGLFAIVIGLSAVGAWVIPTVMVFMVGVYPIYQGFKKESNKNPHHHPRSNPRTIRPGISSCECWFSRHMWSSPQLLEGLPEGIPDFMVGWYGELLK